jgi:hypothetical protein
MLKFLGASYLNPFHALLLLCGHSEKRAHASHFILKSVLCIEAYFFPNAAFNSFAMREAVWSICAADVFLAGA